MFFLVGDYPLFIRNGLPRGVDSSFFNHCRAFSWVGSRWIFWGYFFVKDEKFEEEGDSRRILVGVLGASEFCRGSMLRGWDKGGWKIALLYSERFFLWESKLGADSSRG